MLAQLTAQVTNTAISQQSRAVKASDFLLKTEAPNAAHERAMNALFGRDEQGRKIPERNPRPKDTRSRTRRVESLQGNGQKDRTE